MDLLGDLLGDEEMFSLLSCADCSGYREEIIALRGKVVLLEGEVSTLNNQLNHLIKWDGLDPKSVGHLSETTAEITDAGQQCDPVELVDNGCQAGDCSGPTSVNNQVQFAHPEGQGRAAVQGCAEHVPDPPPTRPFILHNGGPFSHLTVETVCSGLNWERVGSRSVAYFGTNPYRYSNVSHPACPLPPNSTLHRIALKLREIHPTIRFNSVLVTKYDGGSDGLPYHRDAEPSIATDSDILTVVVGDSRTVKFRALSGGIRGKEIQVTPGHGQCYSMSRHSQDFFEHCVPRSPGNKVRVSLTFRQLDVPGGSSAELLQLRAPHPGIPESTAATLAAARSNPPTQHRPTPPSSSSSHPIRNQSDSLNINRPSNKPTTLYISSSMFRHLNGRKLSSAEQEARVFFYPGADAEQMLNRFSIDPSFNGIVCGEVRKVFVLTGTNNIDGITQGNSQVKLREADSDIKKLLEYLAHLLPNASLNLINLFPRQCRDRNLAINRVNGFMRSLCDQSERYAFIDTESTRNLFSTRAGFRNNLYFEPESVRFPDNPHFNSSGVARLGRHLKYLAHN